MKRPILLLALAATLCATQNLFAWGRLGHATVARIAEEHLTKKARANLDKWLDGESIVYYASWLDDYKPQMLVDLGYDPAKGDRMHQLPHTFSVDAEGEVVPGNRWPGTDKYLANCLYYIEESADMLKNRIRELDDDVLLIFITNMAQYAIKGYSVGALDYVLKPVPYFAFSQQLQKAVNQLARRARHYLAVPVDGGMRRLDTAAIYYMESDGHKVCFYTEDGDFIAPGALKAFEEKLANRPFARCNSGYLVNLAQVRGVQQSEVQVGPHTLQISRPRRKAFLAALADYIGGEGV